MCVTKVDTAVTETDTESNSSLASNEDVAHMTDLQRTKLYFAILLCYFVIGNEVNN